MSKPLKFRNQGYGAAKIARRNNVEYTVHYDYWKDGKKADAPYYVGIWDLKNHDNVDTGRSRRFASEQEAFDFCQDVCDGRVRLSDLKNPVYIEAGFGRTCAAKLGIVIPQKRKTAPADPAAPDGEGR